MYMLYCDNCGFYDEKNSAIIDNIAIPCPKCGETLFIEKEGLDDEIAEILEDESPLIDKIKSEAWKTTSKYKIDKKESEAMKRSFEKLGKKKTWKLIEKITTAIDRLYYRRIYEIVGGKK